MPKGFLCVNTFASNAIGQNPVFPRLLTRYFLALPRANSGSSRRLVGAGSSPVSRTKALKTLRFQGFFLFGFDLCGTKLGAGASGEGGCRKGEAA